MAMQSASVSQAAAFLDNAKARQIARAGRFIEWPHCEGDWRDVGLVLTRGHLRLARSPRPLFPKPHPEGVVGGINMKITVRAIEFARA